MAQNVLRLNNMGMWGSLFKKQQEDVYCEKRRRPRLRCAVVTEFADPGGNTWSCKIVDMSESGFGIATGARLTAGSMVNIIRPSVEAKVVWVGFNKAGLRIIR
jgi:hypothetical protein